MLFNSYKCTKSFKMQTKRRLNYGGPLVLQILIISINPNILGSEGALLVGY